MTFAVGVSVGGAQNYFFIRIFSKVFFIFLTFSSSELRHEINSIRLYGDN